MPPRVAIDTNVLLSGVLWPRWPYEVLQCALRGEIELFLPDIVVIEARRRIWRTFNEHSAAFDEFLARLPSTVIPLPTPEAVQAAAGLVRQVEDIPVALSVIAAGVDYFVTNDRDFTDVDATTERVRRVIPGICLPALFLRDVMGWTSDQLEAIRHREWSEIDNP